MVSTIIFQNKRKNQVTSKLSLLEFVSNSYQKNLKLVFFKFTRFSQKRERCRKMKIVTVHKNNFKQLNNLRINLAHISLFEHLKYTE